MGLVSSRFDQGELFRKQAFRDITDIDLIYARKDQIGSTLDPERRAAIELRPDTIIDGEKFRLAHAYGRWWGVIMTGATLFGGATAYSLAVKVPGAGKALLT